MRSRLLAMRHARPVALSPGRTLARPHRRTFKGPNQPPSDAMNAPRNALSPRRSGPEPAAAQ
ncbi:hypothetical protein [Arthrobacter tumbae]|uniref:hypothetical protein n=1 Tax=Arthrobacter tumbae TaxID=163874 RepID=UPI00195D6563|nr:hypothetical protein [Arthrobacter tumbae]MBM7780826.1 hypothetical protein [Arthrobacter tumbae]